MKKLLLFTPLVAASGVSLAQPQFKPNQDQQPTNYVELSSINPNARGYAITAPFTGVIAKVLVKLGDTVVQGQVLIEMDGPSKETAKIEAPVNGKITHLHVSVGNYVEWGDNLIGIN